MKKVLFAVVCSSVLSGLAVLAWTAFSQDARPAGVGDSILRIPACAFDESQDGHDFYKYSTLNFESGSGYFIAPVYLPEGATVQKLVLECADNNATDDIDLYFYRWTATGSQQIVKVSSSGNVVGFRNFGQKALAKNVIKNWKYTYFLYLNLPGKLGYNFASAKIIYTPPTP